MSRDYIDGLAQCFRVPAGQQARHYLLTFVYDRYRDYYFTDAVFGIETAAHLRPTPLDVEARMTRRLPAVARSSEFIADVNRHYLRVTRQMFGRNRERHRQYHPIGIGWLDEPVAKTSATTRHRRRRHPGDEFTHAHVVLQVRDYPSTPPLDQFASDPFPWLLPELQSSLITRFDYLDRSYALGVEWLQLNPTGSLDVRRVLFDDVPQVLDYAAKSAKRKGSLRDDLILLPFADPR
jgi:hypothetical protein